MVSSPGSMKRFRLPYVVAGVVAGLFPIGLLGELVSIGTLLAFVVTEWVAGTAAISIPMLRTVSVDGAALGVALAHTGSLDVLLTEERVKPTKGRRAKEKLLVVSSNGAGYDTVDVEACTNAGVIVTS